MKKHNHGIHNPEVGSSSLPLATNNKPKNDGGSEDPPGAFKEQLRREFAQRVPPRVPLKMDKEFSVTFYTGGVDIDNWENLTLQEQQEALKKPWKIRWWFRNPSTGRLERQTDLKKGVNRLKDKESRIALMNTYKKALISVLKEGVNPYSYPEEKKPETKYSASAALNYALDIKQATANPDYFPQFRKRIDKFQEYLFDRDLLHLDIQLISRRVVSEFLDEILKKTSARTRNNYRADLSSIFTVLSQKFIIESNFIKNDIPKARTQSKSDRRFTREQLKMISEYLNENDPVFLLFIKMMSYNFLRPVEICRLKVSDVDFEGREIYFNQKTKLGKTKYLPNIYINELKALIHDCPGHFQIFTPRRIPMEWTTAEINKRDYWSKQFTKVKKALGLDSQYTLYSFRHTYITGTYVVLRQQKNLSQSQAISILMKITGHTSEEGIKNYIHANDADKPEDWSELIDFRL